MIIDVGSRQLEVRIGYSDGSSLLDVSALVEEFTVVDSHLDSSGLIKTTGTLKLIASPIQPFTESLNPRENPGRWARGNQIRVRVANAAGALTAHPRGRLRILKTPAPPHAGSPYLEIPVGCLLTLQDWRVPPDNATEIPLGESTERHVIINRLATKASLPSLTFATISEWPINHPIATEGSYVETMGRLAWDAGYVLWIDEAERLRRKKVVTRPPSSDFDLLVGRDEAAYLPIEPDETPAETVRAVGVQKVVRPTLDPEMEFATASDYEYSPSQESRTFFFNMASASPLIRRQVMEPRGRLFPTQFPDSPVLTTSSEEENYSYFAETPDGLLRSQYTRVRRPRGVVFPERFPGSVALTTASETYTFYTYNKDVPVVIRRQTYEPAELVSPPEPGQTVSGQALSLDETESWTKTNNGWVKSTRTNNLKQGGSASASTSFSASGNNTPPAPERRQQANWIEEQPISAIARFAPLAGAAFSPREREYEMFAPQTHPQVAAIARLEGGLLHSRQLRVNWALPLSDEWLDYEPLKVLDWTENGITSRYLADGVAFSHLGRRCAVAGDGLHLGRMLNGFLVPPWLPVLEDTAGAVADAVARPTIISGLSLQDEAGAVADASAFATYEGGLTATAGAMADASGVLQLPLADTAGAVADAEGELSFTVAIADTTGAVAEASGVLSFGSVDAIAQAYFDAHALVGSTLTATERTHVIDLAVGLRTAGMTDLEIYIFLGSNYDGRLIRLNPATAAPVVSGIVSADFDANGLAIASGFGSREIGSNSGLGSTGEMSFGAYVNRASGSGSDGHYVGVGNVSLTNGIAIFSATSTAKTFGFYPGVTFSNQSLNTSEVGLFGGSFVRGTRRDPYKNGAKLTSGPNGDNWTAPSRGFRLSGGGNTRIASGYWVGRALSDTEQSTLHSLLHTFNTALGRNYP